MNIYSKDVILIVLVTGIALAVSIGEYMVFGVTSWGFSAIVFGVALTTLILDQRRRLQTSHKELHEAIDNIYSQTEAFISLRSELDIDGMLPAARGWAGSPDFLRELVRIIRTERPLQIVEAGSGLSTVIAALALKKYGYGALIALENDDAFAKKTRSDLEYHGVEDYAEVLHASLKEYKYEQEQYRWYDIEGLGDSPIDLLVIDGPPAVDNSEARFAAVPLLLERLSSTAMILVDDGDRRGDRNNIQRWCSRYGFESTYLSLEKGAYILRPTS